MREETKPAADPDPADHTADRTAGYPEVYRERHGRLVAYATSLTGDPLAAEDLVAEAHFRVWRELRAGEGIPNPSARLATTVRTLAAGLSRSPREGAGRRISQVAVVTRLLRRLPERSASALWYAEVEDLPARAVAARLGIGEGAAALVLRRARKRLRQAFLLGRPGAPVNEACAPSWEQMPEVIGGTASARRSRLLLEHTAVCSDCRARKAALTEADSRLPLLIGPALLTAVLGGSGSWPAPAAYGVMAGVDGNGAKVSAPDGRRARTGGARHARVKPHRTAARAPQAAAPARRALVGSAGVLGVAAAATVLALGVTGGHHAAASAAAGVPTSAASAATAATAPTTAVSAANSRATTGTVDSPAAGGPAPGASRASATTQQAQKQPSGSTTAALAAPPGTSVASAAPAAQGAVPTLPTQSAAAASTQASSGAPAGVSSSTSAPSTTPATPSTPAAPTASSSAPASGTPTTTTPTPTQTSTPSASSSPSASATSSSPSSATPAAPGSSAPGSSTSTSAASTSAGSTSTGSGTSVTSQPSSTPAASPTTAAASETG